MKKIINKFNTGSSLIELIISVMVVGLVVTAVAAASSYSIKNTGEARYKQVATTLGQEVIELMRSEKHRLGYINFDNAFSSSDYCFISPVITDFGDDNATLNSISGDCDVNETIVIAGGTFTRQAAVTHPSEITRVVVTVSWDDGDDTRSVELIQEFKEADTRF